MKLDLKVAKATAAAAMLSGSLLCGSSVSVAQEQAGVSAAVRGSVQIARTGAVGRQVESAEPIFLQDSITSGSRSGMQVLLLDESVFTIGPDSELEIDEFVYDPSEGSGSLAASMTKGVMRFVTGKIAAGKPENMTIKLPVGTIGIRGTVGIVQVLTPEEASARFPDQASQLLGSGGGQAGAPVVFAALVGPGQNNNADAGAGSFNFSTPDGSVDLSRPNASTLATPGIPPLFFIAPPGTIQSVSAGLDVQPEEAGGDDTASGENSSSSNEADSGSDGGGGTQNAENASGQGTAQSFEVALQVGDVTAPVEEGEEEIGEVNEAILNNASSSGILTFDDLRAIQSGSIQVFQTSVNGGAFSYDFFSSLNFGSRSWSIHYDNINNGTTVTNGDILLSGFTYNTETGDATLNQNTPGVNITGCSAGCTFSASVESATSTQAVIDSTVTVDGATHQNDFTLQ